MLKLSCPSCGAEVQFRSKASVFAVCSYCKSTLVRHDMDLENLGKMSQLQDEMSPIQIGTSGSYAGDIFDVIGRLRVSYSDGMWNEWYAIFGNGRTGWLAEAQGFYAMCFPLEKNGDNADASAKVPPRTKVNPGTRFKLAEYGEFLVDDVHDVVCKYSEGELPVFAAKGRKSTSVDIRGPNRKMGTIEYADEGIRVFIGSYQDFDKFKFKSLREIDGW